MSQLSRENAHLRSIIKSLNQRLKAFKKVVTKEQWCDVMNGAAGRRDRVSWHQREKLAKAIADDRIKWVPYPEGSKSNMGTDGPTYSYQVGDWVFYLEVDVDEFYLTVHKNGRQTQCDARHPNAYYLMGYAKGVIHMIEREQASKEADRG